MKGLGVKRFLIPVLLALFINGYFWPVIAYGNDTAVVTGYEQNKPLTEQTAPYYLADANVNALSEEFAGGEGIESNPYLIATAGQLNNVRNYPNSYYRLTADIDLGAYLNGANWEPIGTDLFPFTGTFDGDGHVIRNLNINRQEDNIGLFKITSSSARISNLELYGVNVTGVNCVGALVGNNYGTITNCHVTGSVTGTGDNYAGGLTGNNCGGISNCHFNGTVMGNYNYVGGLVGKNMGSISCCHSEGSVTGENSCVGGLAGYNNKNSSYNCQVNNSYSLSVVAGGEYVDYVGGLIGKNEGTIISSYARGPVTGYNYVGGLAGTNTGSVSKSYYSPNTSGGVTGNGNYVGGLAGDNTGPISQCFSKGSVTGNEDVGGLVGYNIDVAQDGQISDSYAIVAVTGNRYVGGLVGVNEVLINHSYSAGAVKGSGYLGGLIGYTQFNGAAESSYWDIEASGQSESAGGIALHSPDMKSKGTYADWDFNTIWVNDSTINDGYPFLRWKSDGDAVATDKVALTWDSISGANSAQDNVTANLVSPLPTSGANGSTITWSANPGGWINTTTGEVTRPTSAQGDQTVTLTAAITKGEASDTMAFELTLKKGMDECFIATAAFSSKFTWPVALLRHFRDHYLLTNTWGTDFVKFYYHHSPPIAAFIAQSKGLRLLVRILLAPVIAMVYMLYHPILMVIFLMLLIVLLACRVRRRYVQPSLEN
ncbi:MAG: CFI-box-CTERM domain-containing protein [Syntrophomonas sp.]